jgi:DtxR family Mn-dependent transcriptional regulator
MLANQNTVSASLEDYLEAIYHTARAKGAARAKDIVQAMGVNNSSVTQALRLLAEKKLVNYAPYEVITLTSAGERIALDVVRRHETLREFFTKVLGLPAAEADAEACRMEHATSRTILDRLVKFVEYFEKCPLNDVRWDDEAGFFCGDKAEKMGKEGTCGRDTCGHDLDLTMLVEKPQRKRGN